MENKENIAGLGKNHDQEAHDHDIAKKQSEAKPGAENMEMEPFSVNQHGDKGFNPNSKESESDQNVNNVHEKADEYAKKEHEKAENWENNNETGPNSPQF
ncbi:hypothetical protein [Pedobacter boryungensis]|uniref:Uncharacterized protein n=1 Tax=Pedobacter boryungensis TaxID=869962 RepID=A0ABX2DAY4_9SPHI|nr:hypothetical protein [Pedobacter boryungensis]NQX31199.1 hypothetical protein [Pedobacter boryungensis]